VKNQVWKKRRLRPVSAKEAMKLGLKDIDLSWPKHRRQWIEGTRAAGSNQFETAAEGLFGVNGSDQPAVSGTLWSRSKGG
jgi:hypothetical protein